METHFLDMNLEWKVRNKCIKAEAPQATTLIFSEDTKENLKLEDSMKDQQRSGDESGYISTHSGDSGCPYWTTAPSKPKLDKEKEKDAEGVEQERAILVAINTHGVNSQYPRGDYLNLRHRVCRAHAVKMTDDILQWAKEKSGIKK